MQGCTSPRGPAQVVVVGLTEEVVNTHAHLLEVPRGGLERSVAVQQDPQRSGDGRKADLLLPVSFPRDCAL